MNEDQPKRWRPLAILVAALVIWAGLLALGAYLQLGGDQPRHDLRKSLVIMASMGLFLVVWGIALLRRSQRNRQK